MRGSIPNSDFHKMDKMEKWRKIAILLIVLMVISVGFLSGCNEQEDTVTEKENEECSFIGRWIDELGVKWRFDATKFYWYPGDIVIENDYTLTEGWELNTGIMTAIDGIVGKTSYINYVFANCDEVSLHYQSTGETSILTRVE